MVFIADPPAAIGRVRAAWTNNTPSGPPPARVSELAEAGFFAGLTGFVVGLVGFFVVAGILESGGTRLPAEAFLASSAGGALVGAAIGVLRAMRRRGINTLFVGEDGCVELHTRGSSTTMRLTEFRDVDAFRFDLYSASARGIRTTLRRLHMRDTKGKESLWLVSAPPGEAKSGDPQVQYCDAVVEAFAAYRARHSA